VLIQYSLVLNFTSKNLFDLESFRNCPQLHLLKALSFWNVNEEEQVALWREGRRREPMPVEIDF